MARLIWIFAGRTVILLVLSWGGSDLYSDSNQGFGSLRRYGHEIISVAVSLPSWLPSCLQNYLSLVTRKPFFGISDQVRLKPAYSATERLTTVVIWKFVFSKYRHLYYLGSEQQRRWSDCADAWSAPLLFAYGINRFSHDVAHFRSWQCM